MRARTIIGRIRIVKSSSARRGRVLLSAATILAVVAGGIQRGQTLRMVVSTDVAQAAKASPKTISKKERIRQLEKEEFIREHSDVSGKLRPDLWRAGIEQQKHMQVAPYIGWHPAANNSKKSDTSKK